MRIEFSPQARAEFEDGEAYYELQFPGLGARFRVEIRQALLRMRCWLWRHRSSVVISGA